MLKQEKEIELLAEFCGISPSNIGFLDTDAQTLSLKTVDGKKLTGLATICQHIVRSNSQGKYLMGITPEQEAFVHQWLEYRVSHLDYCADKSEQRAALKALNSHLQDKVYFVGNRISLADFLIYFGIHSIYSLLTFQEKELYVHLSRWFNLVQHETGFGDKLQIIPFSKTLLY